MRRIIALLLVSTILLCSCGQAATSSATTESKEPAEEVLEASDDSAEATEESVEETLADASQETHVTSDIEDDLEDEPDLTYFLEHEDSNDYGDSIRIAFYMDNATQEKNLVMALDYGYDDEKDIKYYESLTFDTVVLGVGFAMEKKGMKKTIYAGELSGEHPGIVVDVTDSSWSVFCCTNRDGTLDLGVGDWFLENENMNHDELYDDYEYSQRLGWFIDQISTQLKKIRD